MAKTKKKINSLIKRLTSKTMPSLKIFLVVLVVGVQLALLLTYWFSIYKGNIWATEGIRDTLTYQGKIANNDSVPPPDSQYNFKFTIYDQAASGTLLWTEIWDGTSQGLAGSKVTVSQGVFTVELNSLCGDWVGSCASNGGVTFATDSFYLQVSLDYDGDGNYEEIFLPRKRFTATPYSMNADKLDSRDASDFVLKQGDTMSGNLSIPTLSAQKLVDSSLAAYYQFNGDSSDSSPNALNATLQNNPNIINNVLELDGLNQYASVVDNDLLSFGIGTADLGLTFSAWINMSKPTDFNIISKGFYTADGEYKFFIDGDAKLNLLLFDQSTSNSYIGRLDNTALTDYVGDWIFVTATYSGHDKSSGIKLYVNGIRVDDTTSENNASSYVAMENQAASLYLGNYNANYAKGKMDEVKLYSRELSADEVKRLFNDGMRQQNYSNKFTAHSLYLENVNNDVPSSGYLTWDKFFNRFKFSAEVYAPYIIPYLDNQANGRDYTQWQDTNKKMAYDFSESIGATVTDLAGNAGGILHGNADWTNAGYLGYGLKFGADGDSLSFSNPGLLTEKGSIEMWARINDNSTSATNYVFLMEQSAVANRIALSKQNSADLMLEVGNSGPVDTNLDVPDTKWHHIALVWDNGAYNLYLDGSSVFNSTYTALDATLFDNFYLGANGTVADTSLNGSLDSVAIYDKVLTLSEIKTHAISAYNYFYANYLGDGLALTSVANLVKLPANINGPFDRIDPVYFAESKSFSLAFPEGQGSTTTSNDASLAGTIDGAIWIKDGYYGNALSFDGINDNLTFADDDSIDFGTEDFSLEFWIKCNANDNVSGQRIISKRIGDLGYDVYFSNSGKLKVFIGDGSNIADIESNWSYCDDKWVHVALSFDRDNNLGFSKDLWPYQNSAISNVSGSLSNDATLYIGSDSSNNYAKLAIDSIIFHKNVLSNIYDNAGRVTNSPEFLVINSRSASSVAFAVMNQNIQGMGASFGLLDQNNTGAAPLQLLNEASDSSSGNALYNLINFGTTSGSFGNLKWDNTNNRFIFDRGINQQGNTYTNILEGNTAIGSTNAPTEALEVTGNIVATGSISGNLRLTGGSTPGSTCTIGDITYDSGYIYVCIDTDTWAKAAIAP